MISDPLLRMLQTLNIEERIVQYLIQMSRNEESLKRLATEVYKLVHKYPQVREPLIKIAVIIIEVCEGVRNESGWMKIVKLPTTYEKFKEFYLDLAREMSEKLGETVKVYEEMLRALYDIYIEVGVPYCPCAKVLSKEVICPCALVFLELKFYRECWCGLFYIEEEGGKFS